MNLHSHLEAAHRRIVAEDVDDILGALGCRLVARRRELGRRQEDIAAAAGVTRQCLADIETGRTIATLASYVRVCGALGVDPGPYLRLGAKGQITEHAARYAGGSWLVRPSDPETDRIFPLRAWVRANQANGGIVARRVITVVSEWCEVPKVHDGE